VQAKDLELEKQPLILKHLQALHFRAFRLDKDRPTIVALRLGGKAVNKDRGLDQRVTFMTDKVQRAWLAKQSEITGAPLGVLIRRAIAAYMQIQNKKKS
jgi:hypothetical protein